MTIVYDFKTEPLKHIYQRLANIDVGLSSYVTTDAWARSHALTQVRELLDTIRPTIIESAP